MSLVIETGVAEARTLHPSSDGYFAVLRKNPESGRAYQNMYQLGRLESVVDAMRSAPDSYISQASFLSRKCRRVSHVKNMNCAFVDIDCYKDGGHGAGFEPNDSFVQDLLASARSAGVPEPSYIIYSGRGVYCKWVFDKPISAHQVMRWEMLQNVLVPLYTAFGVDAAVRDVSRVLRVMGSKNTASGSIVRVAFNNNTRYNFDALCAAAEAVDVKTLVWPTKTSTEAKGVINKVTRAKKKLSQANLDEELADNPGDLSILDRFSELKQPFMPKFGTATHLNWSRFVDLRNLMHSRGGIQTGERDLTLFWMANFLAHSEVVTSGNLLAEMESLLGAFSGRGFDPIAEGSLLSLKHRMEMREAGKTIHFDGGDYDPLYRPSNEHLIDVLEISPAEQLNMATLIGGAEKLRRADAKVPGRAERREERIQWRSLARELADAAQDAGNVPNITQIAKAAGVGKAQVSRLLSGKLDKVIGRIETRGRKKAALKDRRCIVIRSGAFSNTIWIKTGQTEEAARAEAAARRRPCSDANLSMPAATGLSASTRERLPQVSSFKAFAALAARPSARNPGPKLPVPGFAGKTTVAARPRNFVQQSTLATTARNERLPRFSSTNPFAALAAQSNARNPWAKRAQVAPPVVVRMVPIAPVAKEPRPVPTHDEIRAMVVEAQRQSDEWNEMCESNRQRNDQLMRAEREEAARCAAARLELMRQRVVARSAAEAEMTAAAGPHDRPSQQAEVRAPTGSFIHQRPPTDALRRPHGIPGERFGHQPRRETREGPTGEVGEGFRH